MARFSVTAWRRLYVEKPQRVIRLILGCFFAALHWLGVGFALLIAVATGASFLSAEQAEVLRVVWLFLVVALPVATGLLFRGAYFRFLARRHLLDPAQVPFPLPHPRTWRGLARREGLSSLLWLVVICFVCWLYLYVALTLVAKFIPSLRTVLFGPSWVFWVTFGLLVLLTSPMAPGVYRAARNDFLARLEHGAPIALTKSLHLREQIGRLTEVAFDASQVAQDLESLVEMQKERLAALLARYETNSHLSSLTEAQAEAVTARLAAAGYRAVRRERLINIVVAAVFMGAGYALSELDPVARWLTEG